MIVPYGKSKNTGDSLKRYSLFNDAEEAPVADEAPVVEEPSAEPQDTISEDLGKVEEVERYLNDSLGGPTLDNLMVVLTAIGMSKISISMSEDKSSLSVSGVINLADDNKIRKEN